MYTPAIAIGITIAVVCALAFNNGRGVRRIAFRLYYVVRHNVVRHNVVRHDVFLYTFLLLREKKECLELLCHGLRFVKWKVTVIHHSSHFSAFNFRSSLTASEFGGEVDISAF